MATVYQAAPQAAPQAPVPPPPGRLHPDGPPDLFGTPQIAGLPSTGDLAANLAQLTIQQKGLNAQRSSLRRQLESMRLDNPGRAGVQRMEANVSVQLAQVEGNIALVRAQLAERQGELVPPGLPSPPSSNRGFDPDLAAGLMFAFIFAVLMPIAIAYARRIWRGKPQPVGPRTEDISPRLERMEQAVDAIAIEIERVSEGQRFVTKILAERGSIAANGAGHGGANAAAVGEATPIRALGAGAMEPIRVPDNEKVRQSNDRR